MKKIVLTLLASLMSLFGSPQLSTIRCGINSLGVTPFIRYDAVHHDSARLWITNDIDNTLKNYNVLYYDYKNFVSLTTKNSKLLSENLYLDGFFDNSRELRLKSLADGYLIAYNPYYDTCTMIQSPEINVLMTFDNVQGESAHYYFIKSSYKVQNDTLVHYDANRQTWSYYDTANSGLSDYNISDLFADSYGNIWINHKYISPKTSSSIDRMDSSGNWYRYARKNTWFPDIYQWKIVTYGDTMFTTPIVNTINEDKKGNVWFGCWSNITRFDGENFFSYPLDTNLYTPVSFGDFQQTPSGDTVWFTTDSGTVAKWHGTIMSFYTSVDQFPDLARPYTYIDKYGDRWESFTPYTYDSWNGQYTLYPARHAVYSLQENSWFIFDTCSWWDSTMLANIRETSCYNPNGGFWFTRDKKT